jgi:2-amino-4-hydroxy-6-hydroxymethyldihydropteridine diphosphokinase
MILIALGSNIDGPWGNPRATVEKALIKLNAQPLKLLKASSLIITEPFGVVNQPSFVNAVAEIETHLSPEMLIARLHEIEDRAGRVRSERWGPRTLDLDILDYNGLIRKPQHPDQKSLVLPHPGIAERLFVLEPLQEIAPNWKHPETQLSAASMIQKL